MFFKIIILLDTQLKKLSALNILIARMVPFFLPKPRLDNPQPRQQRLSLLRSKWLLDLTNRYLLRNLLTYFFN